MMDGKLEELVETVQRGWKLSRPPETVSDADDDTTRDHAGPPAVLFDANVPRIKSVDRILGQTSKRRLIQFCFELMGCPAQIDDFGDDQWQGPNGVVNTILRFCGFTSGRAKTQIVDVLTYVSECVANGEPFDAGLKRGASRSGRTKVLSDVFIKI